MVGFCSCCNLRSLTAGDGSRCTYNGPSCRHCCYDLGRCLLTYHLFCSTYFAHLQTSFLGRSCRRIRSSGLCNSHWDTQPSCLNVPGDLSRCLLTCHLFCSTYFAHSGTSFLGRSCRRTQSSGRCNSHWGNHLVLKTFPKVLIIKSWS